MARWQRRLQRCIHVSPAKSVAELLPLQLGGENEDVEASLAAAVAARDFRQAALLQDLLFVVSPKPALSVADCAPTDADAAANFFLQNGFVCVRELFPPLLLARIQKAWQRAQAPARASWHDALAMGHGGNTLYFENQAEVNKMLLTRRRNEWSDAGNVALAESAPDRALPHGRLFFDIPVQDFFSEALQEDGDPALLDVIDPPKLLEILSRILGDDALLVGVQPRTVPPEKEGGYTTWHR